MHLTTKKGSRIRKRGDGKKKADCINFVRGKIPPHTHFVTLSVKFLSNGIEAGNQ